MVVAILLACTPDDEAKPPLPPASLTDVGWELDDEMRSLVHVHWTQSEPATVHVEYSFDEGIWESTPSVSYEAGTHERVVVGIPFETAAEWRVVAEGGDSVDGAPIVTGFLSANLPRCEVVVSDPDRWLAEGKYILTSINEDNGGWTGGTYWTFIMDRQCRVVWATRTPDEHWTLFAQVAVTGDHILWDEQTYWSDFGGGEDSTVHRTWLDGEIEEIPTPGLHHAFVQLPDQTLVYGSQAHGGDEALVEKAPGQFDETVLWTCADDWPGSGRPTFYTDCESNGLYYDEPSNSYLYSFYTNSSIVQVERGTGATLWWAGDVAGGYTFDPPDAQYSWQHGISYTDAGTLLVSSEWDGGNNGPTETWLMEYEVDTASETLSLVWADSGGTRADTNGQAWRLANGNTLHVLGSASVIREGNLDNDDVWRVDFDGTRLLGYGAFLSDLYPLLKP